jgi:hypothetical protein
VRRHATWFAVSPGHVSGSDGASRVRGDSTRFVIRPQHDAPDVEDVVERHEGYCVVRKHEGEPAELARRADDLTP